jgi:hypothetical protein
VIGPGGIDRHAADWIGQKLPDGVSPSGSWW